MTPADTRTPILDIELPAPPQDDNELLLWALVLTGLFAITAFWFWRHSRTKQYRASLAIKQLMLAVNAQSIDSHACAYEISRLLRSALSLTRICAHTPLPGALIHHQKRWQTFVEIMDQARYSPQPCPVSAMNRLLRDANFWLEQWPRVSGQ